MNLFTAAGMLYGGLQFLSKAKAANAGTKLVYEFAGVKNISFYNWVMSLDVLLRFFNPTKKSITVNYIYLNVSVDGVPIASLKKLDWNITIGGMKETIVSVPVKVDIKTVPALLAKYYKDGIPKQIKVTVKGYVKAEGISVPINQTETYDVF